MQHAREVARALHGTAKRVKILRLPDLPPKGDVSDWLDDGGTAAELRLLARAAPADFAEGLGRRVIYTCEETIFDERGTHFDTNHHHTIRWSKDDLEAAGRDLAATIRATLPDEAVMEDPPDTAGEELEG